MTTIGFQTGIELSWNKFIDETSDAFQLNHTGQSAMISLVGAPTNKRGASARTHVLRWANPKAKAVVVMAGGIVNIADRFRILADSLFPDYECLAFDWYGRGHSDWLEFPERYGFGTNVQQVCSLLKWLGNSRPVFFLGSSLGGMVAMRAIGQGKAGFKGLILNDIGPEMGPERRQRRAKALTVHRVFTCPDQLRQKVGVSEKNSGQMPGWVVDYLALANTEWLEEGKSRHYRYDMACMEQYAKEATGAVNLWADWDHVRCPQLLIHGSESDALTDSQILKMRFMAQSPFKVHTVDGAGHTPSLCVPEQTSVVRNWLDEQLAQ